MTLWVGKSVLNTKSIEILLWIKNGRLVGIRESLDGHVNWD